MKMNAVVQKDLDDELNEKQAARLSVLMGKGGNKSRKKSKKTKFRTKRNTNTTRATNKHAVATAIKDIPLSKARADFAELKAVPCSDINQAAKVGNAEAPHTVTFTVVATVATALSLPAVSPSASAT